METPNLNQTTMKQEAPSFDALAESSGKFLAAKNYNEGQKIKFKVDSFEKMSLSEKYENWQAVYKVTKDTESRLWGMTAKQAKILRDEYGITDYQTVVGKEITMLITKGTSTLTFTVADVK